MMMSTQLSTTHNGEHKQEMYTSSDKSWYITENIQKILNSIISDSNLKLRNPTKLSLIGLKRRDLCQEIKELQIKNPNHDINMSKVFNKDSYQRFIISGVCGHITVQVKENAYTEVREEHAKIGVFPYPTINEISEDLIIQIIDEIAEFLKTTDGSKKILFSKLGLKYPVLSSYAKREHTKNGFKNIFENDKKKRFAIDYGNSKGELGVRLIQITEQDVIKDNIVDEEYKLVKSYNDLIVQNIQTLIGMIEFEKQLVSCIKERIHEINFKIQELNKLERTERTELINHFIKEFKCKIDEDKKDITIREELINKHEREVERIHSLIPNII